MDIVRIGNVELTEEQAFKLYEEKLYIVTYSKIYALHYSNAQKRVYESEIYRSPGMTRRGRFHKLTAADVNRLIGFKLVNEN
jgi:hypothetical protein